METQKTIKKDVKFTGVGLHTGSKSVVTVKPALENSGISFVRVDLPDKPVIEARYTNLCQNGVPRCTSIGSGDAVIHTVEHILSALCGLSIDNATIEIDNNELPGLDGSAIEYFEGIQKAGIVEQDAEKKIFTVREPFGVQHNGSSIYVVPDKEFKISYTLDYDHPGLHSQFFHATINQETFKEKIAPCRTFCLESEAQELQAHGLGKGANYDNTLVIGKDGPIKNTLRFEDECTRHKVLDFIGDLYLLGMPIRGHVFATKSGHKLNLELLRKLAERQEKLDRRAKFIPKDSWGDKQIYDINDILQILPHRYPFLLVDRVIELEKGTKALGIKNVTMNDSFFQGHFPTKPIMPGVLMIEAMAQAAGVVVLTNGKHHGKVALFMSADNVKFRKIVQPGDQLLMEVQVITDKTRTAKVRGVAKVGEDIVAEADMLFSYTDSSYLDE